MSGKQLRAWKYFLETQGNVQLRTVLKAWIKLDLSIIIYIYIREIGVPNLVSPYQNMTFFFRLFFGDIPLRFSDSP